MSAKIKPQWMCEACAAIHDYKHGAQECCLPDVREVYVCPTCGDWHRAMELAEECCDPDAPPTPPTAEELEAAGQLRLAEL